MLLQQYPAPGCVYTSHYGPRQGIYQPMESFRSSNWRSQYLVLSEVNQDKDNKRIKLPPNSFPARSLIKRPPMSSYTFLPLPDTPPPRTETPARKEDSSSSTDLPHGTSPILVMPRHAPHKSSARECPAPQSQTRRIPPGPPGPQTRPAPHIQTRRNSPAPQIHTRHNSPYLISVAVEMHSHPPARSMPQLPQRSAKIFPFLDPLRIHDRNKRFTSRLVELAKLECETVKQEALGHWVYQAPPTNASSVPSAISSTMLHPTPRIAPKVGVTGRVGTTRRIPRETRSKSAKTKAEVESEAKHRTRRRHRHMARSNSQAQRPTATKSTQSLFDLRTVSPSSEANLQCLSLGSLSLVSVEEEKESSEVVTNKRRECFLSSSSCNLKALNTRCHSRRTKNKEKT